MKPSMLEQLIEIIKKSGPVGPSKLANQLQISTQMVHRHLKTLLAKQLIEKIGSPPRVYYVIARTKSKSSFPKLNKAIEENIEKNYLIVKPDGKVLTGVMGFQWWSEKTQQNKQFTALANEYVKQYQEYDKLKDNRFGAIDAIDKIQSTFDHCFLDHLYYQSFYSLPKFGKTKMGQMITLGKSGQDINSIKQLAEICKPSILKIIKYHRIENIIFTPHSIPRKVSFLKEFKRLLALPYPSGKLQKVFAGNVPVAQKSLTKLADRIENADNTIFLTDDNYHERILVIDDAVGSGATLNAIANKLKNQAKAKLVVGFAVTGSIKGFDVISEI